MNREVQAQQTAEERSRAESRGKGLSAEAEWRAAADAVEADAMRRRTTPLKWGRESAQRWNDHQADAMRYAARIHARPKRRRFLNLHYFAYVLLGLLAALAFGPAILRVLLAGWGA